jgi:2-C-methyl-D-erythritol 4-phosphate cytidylyltransferase
MKKYVLIVAGGKGERMQSKVPKQFLAVNGLPLLMHTMQAFYACDASFSFIIVLPSSHLDLWKQLCEEYRFTMPHAVAEGGPARFHSVKSGLKLITDENSLVAVHDAARPLIKEELIKRVFADAERYGNAIPAVAVNESLRERSGVVSSAVSREHFVLVQTPQCFKTGLLKKAYLQAYREDFTDDASVLESDGAQIHLVDGQLPNLKVTSAEDLKMVAALLPSY